MSGTSERPDSAALLATLKPFQRRTVEYAYRRMYEDPDPAYRFLVADEVGLGKTMVARGLIAKAIDHHWDSVDRIDVVYICSNAAIARQNIRKLVPGAGHEQSLATRLTLLPRQLESLESNKLNFVSLTPATSFDARAGHGSAPERVVLYQLLAEEYGESAALRNLLQGNIKSKEGWQAHIDRRREDTLEPNLEMRFLYRYRREAALKGMVDRFLEEVGRRTKLSPEERVLKREAVGALRHFLASICVEGLEPDLVILDEFQRFKHLLSASEEEDEAAALARYMFRYTAPEGHRARVLLLSATPYKMYSTDGEVDDDHYGDFIDTTQFLMDDNAERRTAFEENLRRYRKGMFAALHGDPQALVAAKQAVEAELRKVMVRTERVSATEDRQAMVQEPTIRVDVEEGDIRQYVAADAIARAVSEPEPIEYWKSAPYLVSFMSGYNLIRRITEGLEAPEVQSAFGAHTKAHLNASTLRAYKKVDPANARLRRLMADMLDDDAHQLLWVPPSLPYWPLQGPFAKHPSYSKALVFSAWNVVPDVVSALVSYEAERRALGGRDVAYEHLSDKISRRLEFKVSDGRLAGMPVVALMYPSPTLAEAIDPVALFKAGSTSPVDDAAGIASLLLEPLKPWAKSQGLPDERWYWAAPLLLDVNSGRSTAVLREKMWRAGADEDADHGSTRLRQHLDRMLETAEHRLDPPLGAMPQDLPVVLAEQALGGPGTCALRASRWTGVDLIDRQAAAVLVAEGLRSVFNHPTAIATVDALYGEPYWRAVLKYSIAGNLQSVLDEYLHQVWEQGGWSRQAHGGALREAMAEMASALQLRTSRTKAQPITHANGAFSLGSMNIRTDFARRYGKQRSEDDERAASEVVVRTAFNSPFRPFVLVSTSVGQEGLDFHPWCHLIYHWNLPGNPVDLEQREGRVHRYKGHAVRRNVAAKLEQALRSELRSDEDPWERLFLLAEGSRKEGQSELVPHWLFDGAHSVERRVPVLPYSKDAERLSRLRRELAAYRLVFGQPRQQELLELLKKTALTPEVLESWAIDLRPRMDFVGGQT